MLFNQRETEGWGVGRVGGQEGALISAPAANGKRAAVLTSLGNGVTKTVLDFTPYDKSYIL